MGERFQPPVMFPCAAGVKMPHVGADESTVTPSKLQLQSLSLNNKRTNVIDQVQSGKISQSHSDVVKGVTTNLSFSEDVVKERCFYMLKYDNKYLAEALDASDIIPTAPPKKAFFGRYNKRGSDKRHMPCHISVKETKPKTTMKKEITHNQQIHEEAVIKSRDSSESGHYTPDRKETEDHETHEPSVFITEDTIAETEKSQSVKREWDEYLMSLLSKNTAQWIVNQQMSPSEPKQAKLKGALKVYHGVTKESTELLPDTVSETEFPIHEEEPKHSKYKKTGESLLEQVRKIELRSGKQTDPYSNDTDAAFYRLPAGFRRAKKQTDKEEAGAINQTAYKIEVKPFVAKPLPTLKDWVNPAVGDKVYSTENLYEQEWLTGGKQVYQKVDQDGKIIMASRNKYQKVLQGESPKKPQHWYKDDKESVTLGKMMDKGLHRWQKLPQLIDETTTYQDIVSPGTNPQMRKSPDPASIKQANNNTVLSMIVDDWRKKWHLDMRYADASPEDLIRDMADLHPNIRLKAITTCARAAEYRPPKQAGIVLANDNSSSQVKLLPENLYVALQCCLDDRHEKVRMAAAIALFTLERPCPQADKIMRDTLKQQKSVDRWTAAQCLAYYGECDSAVVGELVSQLLNSEDKIRHEQAAYLLGRLSENSTLVHCMLGEQLNSSCWRHRVMVCRTLPKLCGHINKDLVNKLTQLMWHDWHQEVRKAAAQCLGKTGHGKEVHDELMHKMLSSTERIRVEAISKVGHLGFMTAKILPVFLKCFDDTYVSVRTETCLACSNLVIQEDQIVEKLVYLATYDPIWKVKALAIQALGNISKVNKSVRSCILWALRYEDQEGVRAEACHTAMKLEFKDTDVVEMLQDRLLTEHSAVVRKEIMNALEQIGISPTEDMDMVARIKNEVRKLGTCKNIAAQITANEKEVDRKANISRMIAQSKQDKKSEKANARPRSHASSTRAASSRPLDSSRLTPVADQEIITIMHRKDSPSSYSEHLTDAASRQKSAKTVTTEATEDMLSQLDEDEYDQDNTSNSQDQSKQEDEAVTVDRELNESHSYMEICGHNDNDVKSTNVDRNPTEETANHSVNKVDDNKPVSPVFSDIVDVLDFKLESENETFVPAQESDKLERKTTDVIVENVKETLDNKDTESSTVVDTDKSNSTEEVSNESANTSLDNKVGTPSPVQMEKVSDSTSIPGNHTCKLTPENDAKNQSENQAIASVIQEQEPATDETYGNNVQEISSYDEKNFEKQNCLNVNDIEDCETDVPVTKTSAVEADDLCESEQSEALESSALPCTGRPNGIV